MDMDMDMDMEHGHGHGHIMHDMSCAWAGLACSEPSRHTQAARACEKT